MDKKFSLTPKNLTEAMQLADILSKSTMVPTTFHGKPGDVMAAVQMGADLGLSPMQALQNISVIKGRPCVWGDALLAIAKAHPEFEYIKETDMNDCATCEIKRKNQPAVIHTFSNEDAKQARLLPAKEFSAWKCYPKRMRQMRARGFAIRDSFPDALKGMRMAEEVRDYKIIEGESKTEKPAKRINNKGINIKRWIDRIIQLGETKEGLLDKLGVSSLEEIDESFVQSLIEIGKSLKFVSKEQIADMMILITDNNIEEAKVCEAFGIKELSNLQTSKYNEAIDLITKNKAEQNE